jgi:hypothetical protein
MPSNKIVSALIICLSLVASVWLFNRSANIKPIKIEAQNTNTESVTVDAYQKIADGADDSWKKILVNVQPKDEKVAGVVKNEGIVTKAETSITSQIAKNLLSQAFVASKSEKGLTQENVNKISEQILSSQSYIKTQGAKYLPSNLHVIQNNDKESLKKYYIELNNSLKNRLTQIKVNDDPMAILEKALNSDDASQLTKMDAYITANQAFINDLLNINVPSDAAKLHLELLNASSDILSNMQSMRNTFVDPVTGMAGMSQYNLHMDNFVQVLKKIIKYFNERLA